MRAAPSGASDLKWVWVVPSGTTMRYEAAQPTNTSNGVVQAVDATANRRRGPAA